MAALLLGALCPAGAAAQDALPEVTAGGEATRLVYSVNRTPERTFDTSRAVQVITAEDIWRRNARTIPELLMEEAGVFVQQTNYAGGAPIVRGLMGKQIVIMVDGVRLNNATFRFGGLQYLNTIDLDAVERIEIVRGVESVLGSDSLGGLVNIVLRKGPATEQAVGAAASARLSTADDSRTGHVQLFGRIERFRYSFGTTVRDTDDVIAGGGVGRQVENAYSEQAVALNAEYAVSSSRTLALRYHTLEQAEVGLGLGSGRNAATTFQVIDPQRLHLLAVEYQDLTKHRLFDQFQVSAYLNRQQEGAVEIRSTAPSVERRNSDRDHLIGTSLALASFVGRSHRLLYGLDFTSERIRSERRDVNVATGAVARARGKFTDNSTYATGAVYVQDRFDVNTWLTTTVGARYGRSSAGGVESSTVAVLDLASNQTGLTGSAGAVVHLSPTINLVANVTRGFRAPNIEDLSKYDERREGTEVPNPALEPEHSLTSDVGIKVDTSRVRGSAFYYVSRLTNLHDRRAGLWNGLSFFDLNGNAAREANEPNVLQRVNVGRARVHGVEIDALVRLTSAFDVMGNIAATSGADHVLNEPMSRIPPTFGMVALRWSPDGSRHRLWSELAYAFATEQRRVSTRDASDLRIGRTGTDGWNVLHVRAGFDLQRHVRLSLGVENLFDEAYKYHASGVYRPGRQFVFGTKFRY